PPPSRPCGRAAEGRDDETGLYASTDRGAPLRRSGTVPAGGRNVAAVPRAGGGGDGAPGRLDAGWRPRPPLVGDRPGAGRRRRPAPPGQGRIPLRRDGGAEMTNERRS